LKEKFDSVNANSDIVKTVLTLSRRIQILSEQFWHFKDSSDSVETNPDSIETL